MSPLLIFLAEAGWVSLFIHPRWICGEKNDQRRFLAEKQ